jgi:hypothetical protein
MKWKSILLWGAIAVLSLFLIMHSLPLVIGQLLGIAADLGWLKDCAGKIGK